MTEGMNPGPDSEAPVGTVAPIATIVATRGALTGTALGTIAVVATIVAMIDVMIEEMVDATLIERLTQETKPVQMSQWLMLNPAMRELGQTGGKTRIRLYPGACWSR